MATYFGFYFSIFIYVFFYIYFCLLHLCVCMERCVPLATDPELRLPLDEKEYLQKSIQVGEYFVAMVFFCLVPDVI